jgi:hypothetical protein
MTADFAHDSGEGFVRWCFASSVERLGEGVERLRKAVTTLRW